MSKEMKDELKITAMRIAFFAAFLFAVVAITGCRAVTVENYGEEVARDAEGKPVILADGSIQTVKKGWRVHHNQHWMTTSADSINATVKPKEIAFAMNGLNTKPSEELAHLVDVSLDGMTKLVVAVGEAYTKIAGGGAQADTALNVAAKVANYFKDKGGDVTKAEVTTVGDKLRVSDGTTCVECDAAGNCSDCELNR